MRKWKSYSSNENHTLVFLSSTKSISVLIANYKWDVSALIIELQKQLKLTKASFEILCYDNSKDSAFEVKNQKLNTLENVTYRLEHEHIGRSQNRNKLAQDAKHDWFLFLDGDSTIVNPNFISSYLKTSQSAMVVCGGTAYAEKPKDQNLLLRWTYGKMREELPAEQRNENPNSGFSSFNFLIQKEAFLATGFDNSLTEYGHEDTLLGQALKAHHFNILHINNSLVHLGLDENELFLEKTKKAIENLKFLIDSKTLASDSKLTAYYNTFSKTRTKLIFAKIYKKNKGNWEANLCGPNPKMRTFDLYKLGYICSL